MIVCGIELSGNDAIICLLKQDEGLFILPECRSTRIQCTDPDRAEDLAYFQKSFIKLAEDYKVDKLVIRARQKKGKFAGGANGFKLEAILQVTPKLNVTLLGATEQKLNLKSYALPISFHDTKLKKFQEPAFMAAFAYLAGLQTW